ncbi:MAG: sigma-54-dependent Fis family transcriptional regulator [Planctomycetes bacterium]|nr:sigma-54-dependent Fis family transcriptional regulator [Planctomycetota bacterium]
MARWAHFLQRLRGDVTEVERQRMTAILGLNRSLVAAADRGAVLTVLVDEAVRLFGAERGFLVRRLADEPGFAVEVARSLDREAVGNPERKLSRTVLHRALQGEGLFSADAQADDLSAAQSVADLRLRSVLCTPLRVGDDVLGVLYLDHRFQAGAFGERDLPWLMAFADQGALAVHLHGLLQQNRQQAAQLAEQNRSLQATVAAQAEALAAPAPTLTRAAFAHTFPGLIGDSPALLRVLHVLDRVVDTDLPVLLTGESGTGKEVAARALHAGGSRRRGSFVGVNVAAISEGLLESELFGHTKGAFTGADRDRVGLLRQAAGGTLFLDEITEMGPDLQARLLRALEQRRVRPVGGDREFAIDVRIVAATNRDPRQAMREGRLREDLYFRLAVVAVVLPPLRERLDDVVPLAEHFLDQLAREQGLPPVRVEGDLAAALRARTWPGNVRQLRNEMQRLWALAAGGPLQAGLLSPEPAGPVGAPGPVALDLAAVERWAIDRALQVARGNKAEAARLLGIGRRTLYDRLAERPAGDAPG